MKKINLKNTNIFPNYLWLHSEYHQKIRQWLDTKYYHELWCPPLSNAPCFETHVHPLQVYSPKTKTLLELFLHTSPEFVLKNVILNTEKQHGFYSLNYVFRDDPFSPIHRKQFIMLEFYRLNPPVENLIIDLKSLINFISTFLQEKNIEILPVNNITNISVDDLFKQYCNFSILDFLYNDELYQKIKKDFPQFAPAKILPWDDLFNLLWLNIIEEHLKDYSALLITDYPAPLSLLAQKNKHDPRIGNRFELFVHGNEIANGYAEAANFSDNKKAIEEHLKNKKREYGYQLSEPEQLLASLKNKNLPECYGVAVGTERLLQTLTQMKSAFVDY